MVRAMMCWLTTWLMGRYFGITPEGIAEARAQLEAEQASRVIEHTISREMNALCRELELKVHAAKDDHARTRQLLVGATHTACKYRNALKAIELSRTHNRAIVIAKEATRQLEQRQDGGAT